jgi:hypothetical protein
MAEVRTSAEDNHLAKCREHLEDYLRITTDRGRVACLLDAQEELMTLWLIVKRRQLEREKS